MLKPTLRTEPLTEHRGSQPPSKLFLIRRLWLSIIAPFVALARLFSTLFKGAVRLWQYIWGRPEHRHTAPFDIGLIAPILILIGFGLVMVGSASMDMAQANYGNPFMIVFKQLLFAIVGLVAMAVMTMVPLHWIEKYSWSGYLIALAILVLVLLVGREINGSIRWIPLGFFNLQASEVAKLCVVVYIAGYLVRQLETVRNHWSGFVIPMSLIFILAALLLAEPDMGSTVVMMSTVVGMIFLAGVRLRWIVLVVILGAVAFALLVWAAPYRLARLTSYMDPWADAFGNGYQLTQALIAFGRGAWTGEGLGNSIQKLFYLPEAHTDFVFAVVAEELGAIGALLLLALFLFVICRALVIGMKSEVQGNLFGGYLAYGLALLFGFQVIINLGVSTGALPTKGLALPMISYGGSSLIVNCIAFGLLIRVDIERRALDALNKLNKHAPRARQSAQ